MRGVLWGTEFWHFNVHQFQYDRVELKAFFSYCTWATETCWFLAFDVQRTFQMLSSSERNRLWKGLSFCWIFLLVFYLQDLVHFFLPLKHHFQPVESEDWQTAAQWKGTKHLNRNELTVKDLIIIILFFLIFSWIWDAPGGAERSTWLLSWRDKTFDRLLIHSLAPSVAQ